MVFHDCGRSFLGVAQDCGWIRLLDKSHQVTFLTVAIFEMLQDIETPEPTKVLPEYSQRKLLPWLFGKLRKGTIHRPPYPLSHDHSGDSEVWDFYHRPLNPDRVPSCPRRTGRAAASWENRSWHSIDESKYKMLRWTLMTLVFCRV